MIYLGREFLSGHLIEVTSAISYLSSYEVLEIGTQGVIYDIVPDTYVADATGIVWPLLIQIYWSDYELHRNSPELAPWSLIPTQLDKVIVLGMTTIEQRQAHWSRLIKDLVIYES